MQRRREAPAAPSFVKRGWGELERDRRHAPLLNHDLLEKLDHALEVLIDLAIAEADHIDLQGREEPRASLVLVEGDAQRRRKAPAAPSFVKRGWGELERDRRHAPLLNHDLLEKLDHALEVLIDLAIAEADHTNLQGRQEPRASLVLVEGAMQRRREAPAAPSFVKRGWGELERDRRHAPLLSHDLLEKLDHALEVLIDLAIAEADHIDLQGREKSRAGLVLVEGGLLEVLRAIELDGKTNRWAEEVNDVRAYTVLAIELEAQELPIANEPPEALLLRRLFPSELSAPSEKRMGIPGGGQSWVILSRECRET
ncbi:MAG: hypothetical protein DIJKHBIC_00917 [Thermoanaerobaculia bacterium]|nr:hypothetical protein [Thermoanaerobaculia bacterium]